MARPSTRLDTSAGDDRPGTARLAATTGTGPCRSWSPRLRRAPQLHACQAGTSSDDETSVLPPPCLWRSPCRAARRSVLLTKRLPSETPPPVPPATTWPEASSRLRSDRPNAGVAERATPHPPIGVMDADRSRLSLATPRFDGVLRRGRSDGSTARSKRTSRAHRG